MIDNFSVQFHSHFAITIIEYLVDPYVKHLLVNLVYFGALLPFSLKWCIAIEQD